MYFTRGQAKYRTQENSTEIEVSKEGGEQPITQQGDTGKKGGVSMRNMESKLAFAVLGIDLTESKSVRKVFEQQARTNIKKQVGSKPWWCFTFFETSSRNPS